MTETERLAMLAYLAAEDAFNRGLISKAELEAANRAWAKAMELRAWQKLFGFAN